MIASLLIKQNITFLSLLCLTFSIVSKKFGSLFYCLLTGSSLYMFLVGNNQENIGGERL